MADGTAEFHSYSCSLALPYARTLEPSCASAGAIRDWRTRDPPRQEHALRAYGVKRTGSRLPCPGHDKFPTETYRSRRSKRARAAVKPHRPQAAPAPGPVPRSTSCGRERDAPLQLRPARRLRRRVRGRAGVLPGCSGPAPAAIAERELPRTHCHRSSGATPSQLAQGAFLREQEHANRWKSRFR